ncbi:hypothetical protein M408DRAFT_328919 [Serendipita vermifera MAFF 305830]|uniref:Uncharacterized protein n=1 Tax=Serendipita vermifera MAFF 305830 TaxID=933852 RepID=A0A0C2WSY6_SERVB|nr:hypothetical protein M408DRAFT_328919 [Serendipita vermifera MAFF 305830]
MATHTGKYEGSSQNTATVALSMPGHTTSLRWPKDCIERNGLSLKVCPSRFNTEIHQSSKEG